MSFYELSSEGFTDGYWWMIRIEFLLENKIEFN